MARKEETPLTAAESKAYQILSKADRDTPWGAGIGVALDRNSPTVFRELIKQLKSQMHDQPSTMEKIIGIEGVAALTCL